MSGLWLAYRPTSGCYGMSERIAPDSVVPQTKRARNDAARISAKGKPDMSKSRFSFPFVVVLACASLPAVAEGKVPLPEEAHINEQLIAGAAGDILRNTCPSLSARMLVVWTKLNALEKYARAQGYTEDEVKAFLKDRAQRARVKTAARDYVAAAGAVEGNVESFCAAGRSEIAKGTLVGSLLRSSK